MRADALRRLVCHRSNHRGKGRDHGDDRRGTSSASCELVIHRRVDNTELADGMVLHPDTARRLSCDADVRVTTHRADWSPADVGRRQRLVTPRLRRLVHERDRHCTFPDCTATTFLEVNHIVHWEHGGATDLSNLTSREADPFC